jgi:hypothetical protein
VTLRRALLAVALIGALVIHLMWDVSLGIALLIFFVGWPIVGTMVTIDDDLPGGWSNPNGRVRPDWLEAPLWGQIVVGVAISVVGFAIDAGWRSPSGLRLWSLAIGVGSVGAALSTRRWWIAVGLLVALGALAG